MAEKHTGFECTGDIDLATNSKNITALGATFDTTTLHIDSANHRVGIGTITPSTILELAGANPCERISGTTGGFLQIAGAGLTTGKRNYEIRAYTGVDGLNFLSYPNDWSGAGTNIFTILQSGKVGIGTTTPSVKLDVIGDTKIGTKDLFVDTSGHAVGIGTITPDTENISGAEYCIDIHADTSGALSMFSTSRNGADGAFIGAFIGVADDQDANYRDVASFNFLMDGTTDGKRGGMIKFYTQADNSSSRTAKMTIKQTGYVGIGTETPACALDVVNATNPVTRSTRTSADTNIQKNAFQIIHKTSGNMADGFGVLFSFAASDTGIANSVLGRIGAVRDGGDLEGALTFFCGTGGAEEFMRIDNDGQVGIGTSSPDSKLHVDGLITTNAFAGAIVACTTSSDAFDVSNAKIVQCQNGVVLGGLAGGVVGQIVVFTNYSGGTITFEHDEATGTQKFITISGADTTLTTKHQSIRFYKDTTYWIQL